MTVLVIRYSFKRFVLVSASFLTGSVLLFFEGKDVRAVNLAFRVLFLMVGMFLATVGIALVTLADLGTTPISTVPYVFSVITGYSFGLTTFVVNLFFILGQADAKMSSFNASGFSPLSPRKRSG